MLWQLAYAELFFKKLADFGPHDLKLLIVIKEYKEILAQYDIK